MRIEMNEEAAKATMVIALATALVLIACLIHNYNALAYEKGYTQKQIQTAIGTMWVKE